MAAQIEVESGLASFLPPIAERLGLPLEFVETLPPTRPEKYISVSVARSPHNQVVTYPAITSSCRDSNRSYELLSSDQLSANLQSEVITLLPKEAGARAANFIFDSDGKLVSIFPGITRESLWTLEFSYISHFENALRACHDLPLGSAESALQPWYLLEFQAPPHLDMVKPYLHLFAHNPRYRIVKLSEFSGYVALGGSGNLIGSAEHAVDYLEGVIDE